MPLPDVATAASILAPFATSVRDRAQLLLRERRAAQVPLNRDASLLDAGFDETLRRLRGGVALAVRRQKNEWQFWWQFDLRKGRISSYSTVPVLKHEGPRNLLSRGPSSAFSVAPRAGLEPAT